MCVCVNSFSFWLEDHMPRFIDFFAVQDVAQCAPPGDTSMSHSRGVVIFRIVTGHDCLAEHLYRIGYFPILTTLCGQREVVGQHHLLRFSASFSTSKAKDTRRQEVERASDPVNILFISINRHSMCNVQDTSRALSMPSLIYSFPFL
jgi:hypothetical protein